MHEICGGAYAGRKAFASQFSRSSAIDHKPLMIDNCIGCNPDRLAPWEFFHSGGKACHEQLEPRPTDYLG